ncbi:MAG: hypothetical protein M5U22_02475 [Thermoleophilia bacterium]|nr:hypothetical protein [Thermoleophilia bacterium]
MRKLSKDVGRLGLLVTEAAVVLLTVALVAAGCSSENRPLPTIPVDDVVASYAGPMGNMPSGDKPMSGSSVDLRPFLEAYKRSKPSQLGVQTTPEWSVVVELRNGWRYYFHFAPEYPTDHALLVAVPPKAAGQEKREYEIVCPGLRESLDIAKAQTPGS